MDYNGEASDLAPTADPTDGFRGRIRRPTRAQEGARNRAAEPPLRPRTRCCRSSRGQGQSEAWPTALPLREALHSQQEDELSGQK